MHVSRLGQPAYAPYMAEPDGTFAAAGRCKMKRFTIFRNVDVDIVRLCFCVVNNFSQMCPGSHELEEYVRSRCAPAPNSWQTNLLFPSSC